MWRGRSAPCGTNAASNFSVFGMLIGWRNAIIAADWLSHCKRALFTDSLPRLPRSQRQVRRVSAALYIVCPAAMAILRPRKRQRARERGCKRQTPRLLRTAITEKSPSLAIVCSTEKSSYKPLSLAFPLQ